ncbi:carbohydrate kinase family protein [Leptolyngbya sp. 7M]|uniref:carbohydrate kinase family protein n=1 Tax=Leptolyngbya sp. 7M TaxID=2812896 RepID=UPI001B8AB2DD|nr:carbohydrate kinase family protein [Leptolyngbya sp. 7M]QYO68156.1 carbohydrate kinase family protein [Leptolyngbya sp. 7M]
MRFPFKLDPTKEFDVVGFGTNAVDHLIIVPEYPQFSGKIKLSGHHKLAGGEVASTMVGLSRLGLHTAYAGRFGSDEEGAFGMETLRSENVDLRFAERIDGARNQIAFIVIDERNGERTVIWDRDVGLSYTKADAPIAAAYKCRALHLTPHDVDAAVVMAAAAKQASAVVSTDIDNLFEGIEQLLPLADILIFSENVPTKLAETDDIHLALLSIAERFGSGVVGVTLGSAGSLLYSSGEFITTKGYSVPGGCRDTTGAGDAFRVGILYGLLKGESIERSAEMANAVAALKCRSVGARTALPTESELLEFVRE